ncbi:hypothetical protein OG216_31180 [Streptomycetaceae bacterium NBC_01309]
MARSHRRRSSAARGNGAGRGRPLDLAEAAARVAERFAGTAVRSLRDGCGHCFTADERLLLATPDAPLERGLAMRAAWKVPHFDDMDGLMRRVLPALATAIVDGEYDMGRALRGLAWARFREWPPSMVAPVLDLLDTWFLTTLRGPGDGAHVVLEACAAADNGAGRWLAMWEREKTPVADAHLAQAAWWWAGDIAPPTIDWLLSPDDVIAELRAWLAGYAAERMAAYGAPPELIRRLRGLVPAPGAESGGEAWDGVLLPRPSEWAGVRPGPCT